MKIAMMVRAFMASPVPNDIAYSPTGVAVSIAEGLSARGHDITFFGPEGTQLGSNVKVVTNNVRPLVSTAQQLYEMIATTDLFQDYIPSLYDQFMVRDMFDVKENAKVFSMLMLVVAVSPIIAPTAGGYVTALLGWRWVYPVLYS